MDIDEEKMTRVKALYEIIVNREIGDDADGIQRRIGVIKELERLCKTEFVSTEDFHFKIQRFLTKGKASSSGAELRKARQKMGWSQKELSEYLGCTQSTVAMMEKGERPPSKKALYFVELSSFPVHNKSLIIKQLQKWAEKPSQMAGEA